MSTKMTTTASPSDGSGALRAQWKESRANWRRERNVLIAQALREAGGNRTLAARLLGMQRTYLVRLLRNEGIAGIPAGTPGAPGHLSRER